jgi:hypothetical protein
MELVSWILDKYLNWYEFWKFKPSSNHFWKWIKNWTSKLCCGSKATRRPSLHGQSGLLQPRLNKVQRPGWPGPEAAGPGQLTWPESGHTRCWSTRWRGLARWVHLHSHGMAWPAVSRLWPKLEHDSTSGLKATLRTGPTRWFGRRHTEARWRQGRRISSMCRGVLARGGRWGFRRGPAWLGGVEECTTHKWNGRDGVDGVTHQGELIGGGAERCDSARVILQWGGGFGELLRQWGCSCTYRRGRLVRADDGGR